MTSDDVDRKSVYDAWTSEQVDRIARDGRRARIGLIHHAVRYAIDRLRVWLPDPRTSSAARASRSDLRRRLFALARSCQTRAHDVVQEILSHDDDGIVPDVEEEEEEEEVVIVKQKEEPKKKKKREKRVEPAPFNNPFDMLSSNALSSSLIHDDMVAALHQSVGRTMRPLRTSEEALHWLRHVIMATWNDEMLDWAAMDDGAARAAYIKQYEEDYDWRGESMDPAEETAKRTRVQEEENTSPALRAVLDARDTRDSVLSAELAHQHLDYGTTLAHTGIHPTHRAAMPPPNGAVVPGMYRNRYMPRLVADLYANLHLRPTHPTTASTWGKLTTLSQVLVGTDGLRPVTMMQMALGIMPLIARLDHAVEPEEARRDLLAHLSTPRGDDDDDVERDQHVRRAIQAYRVAAIPRETDELSAWIFTPSLTLTPATPTTKNNGWSAGPHIAMRHVGMHDRAAYRIAREVADAWLALPSALDDAEGDGALHVELERLLVLAGGDATLKRDALAGLLYMPATQARAPVADLITRTSPIAPDVKAWYTSSSSLQAARDRVAVETIASLHLFSRETQALLAHLHLVMVTPEMSAPDVRDIIIIIIK